MGTWSSARRCPPRRVRSRSSCSNLLVAILVAVWKAHLTRTRASTTTCAVPAKWIHGRVATSIKFEETVTYDAPEVIYATATPTTATLPHSGERCYVESRLTSRKEKRRNLNSRNENSGADVEVELRGLERPDGSHERGALDIHDLFFCLSCRSSNILVQLDDCVRTRSVRVQPKRSVVHISFSLSSCTEVTCLSHCAACLATKHRTLHESSSQNYSTRSGIPPAQRHVSGRPHLAFHNVCVAFCSGHNKITPEARKKNYTIWSGPESLLNCTKIALHVLAR